MRWKRNSQFSPVLDVRAVDYVLRVIVWLNWLPVEEVQFDSRAERGFAARPSGFELPEAITTGKDTDDMMKSRLIETAVTEFLLIAFAKYFRQLFTIRVFRYSDWHRRRRGWPAGNQVGASPRARGAHCPSMRYRDRASWRRDEGKSGSGLPAPHGKKARCDDEDHSDRGRGCDLRYGGRRLTGADAVTLVVMTLVVAGGRSARVNATMQMSL